MKQTLFITGTDTGAGKTVMAALLTRFLRERGVNAAALKPLCSGGRSDARALHSAMNGALALDEINPWHFRAPIAPLLAARQEGRRVLRSQVIAHIRLLQKRFDVMLVEGAGGLLSPLGEDFNSRDLVAALSATPIIVAPNKLGVVNHLLLTLEAMTPAAAQRAHIVLMSPPKPDRLARANLNLMEDFFDARKIFPFPWLGKNFNVSKAVKNLRGQKVLSLLVKSAFTEAPASI